MRIIKDERDHATKKLCEHCETAAAGREVEVRDWITRKSRGFYFLCFRCFGPRIFWRPRGKYAKTMESPAKL